MRNRKGSLFFIVEGLSEGTEYMHLGDWIIVAKDALEVVFLMQNDKLRKNGEAYLELIN